MKRGDATNVEVSCVPAATPQELGYAEHVESRKNRKMLIKSHVRIARKYAYNATAVAAIVANMYVKNVHMIHLTSGGSLCNIILNFAVCSHYQTFHDKLWRITWLLFRVSLGGEIRLTC